MNDTPNTLGFGEPSDTPNVKLPSIKMPAPKKRKAAQKPPIDVESLDFKKMTQDSGFNHRESSKPKPNAKANKAKVSTKLSLPKLGDMPLDYTPKDAERGILTVHGPQAPIDEFLKLRGDYAQPSWVILSMLIENFKANPPK